ncbi:UNVERIFIED_CONTAM: hypothetical protein RMT77_008347 [Armadillidium vulgare]
MLIMGSFYLQKSSSFLRSKMKFLYFGLCVFLFVFLMNFNKVSSSVRPIRKFPDICYVIMDGCPNPKYYTPPPSCLLKTCPRGTYCCHDGCSYTCNPIEPFRKDDDDDLDHHRDE